MNDEKRLASNNDESMDLFEDDVILEGESVVAGSVDTELPETPCASSKANPKLANKRRLEDYLERKWFKDNGWDDDDELFNDEYFEH